MGKAGGETLSAELGWAAGWGARFALWVCGSAPGEGRQRLWVILRSLGIPRMVQLCTSLLSGTRGAHPRAGKMGKRLLLVILLPFAHSASLCSFLS